MYMNVYVNVYMHVYVSVYMHVYFLFRKPRHTILYIVHNYQSAIINHQS